MIPHLQQGVGLFAAIDSNLLKVTTVKYLHFFLDTKNAILEIA